MHSNITAQQTGEFMVRWTELDDGDKTTIAGSLMLGLGIVRSREKVPLFLRAMEQARPMLVMGKDTASGKCYCRVAACSALTTAALITEYIDPL